MINQQKKYYFILRRNSWFTLYGDFYLHLIVHSMNAPLYVFIDFSKVNCQYVHLLHLTRTITINHNSQHT